MTRNALYPIFDSPVRLEKVFEGLWVSTAEPRTVPEDEYFRSAQIFTEPMRKCVSTSDVDGGGKANQ